MSKESRAGAQGSAGDTGTTGPQGAAGNAKGALEATSNTLPTAPVGTADEPAEITALRWTLQPGAGITAGGVASRLHEPRLRSEQAQLGFFFNVEVGGTVINETFAPLRRGNSSLVNPDVIIFFQDNRRVIVRQSLDGDWRFYGVGSTLPANSVIKIYRAIVRGQTGVQGAKGDKGDKGDPGPQGPQGAAGNAKGALEATSNTLPTAPVGTADEPAEITALRWALQPGAGIAAVRISAARLHEPRLRSEQAQFGFFFDVEVGGVLINETFVPLSRGKTSVYPNPDAVLFFGGNRRVIVRQFLNGAWRFMGVGSTLPANSVIKIYRAIVRGQTGASDELSVRASLPSTSGFSVGDIINLSGVLYELVANTEDPNVYRGTIAQTQTNYLGDATFEYQTVSPYNVRLNLLKSGVSSPPASLYITVIAKGAYGDIEMSRASGSDTSQRYAYNKVPGDPTIDPLPIGEPFEVRFFSDGGFSKGFTIHAANRWERDDRNDPNIDPIALAGNTDRWPKNKLPSDVNYSQSSRPAGIAAAEIFPGLTLTTTTPDAFGTAPSYFSPTIDLDDHSHGEFHCSLELTIAPVSDVNMGFVQGKANQTADDRNVSLSNILFASDVAEEDAFVQQTQLPLNGLSLFRQTVYSGSTIVGHYNVILVRNASNQVGAYWYWDGQAGGTGATLTAELRVTFTPSDAPAVSSVRNTRGALQVTSPILPTASVADNQPLNEGQWVLATNSYMTLVSGKPTERRLPAIANQIGWWIVSEVNGTEIEAILLPFGLAQTPATFRLDFSATSNDARVRIAGHFILQGDNNPLPANSRIKIYTAVI